MSKPRKVRILRDLEIDEVSSCRVGANPGARVAIMKRDDDQRYNKFAKIFGAKPRRSFGGYDPAAIRKDLKPPPRDDDAARFQNATDDDAAAAQTADANNDTSTASSTQQIDAVRGLADMVITASGGKINLAQALAYLLHSPHGQSLIRRTLFKQHDEQRKEQPTMSITEQVRKAGLDPISVCKTIASEGKAYSITEHELTELIQKHASANRLLGESAASAFARVFTADDDTGLTFRKAIQIAKGVASLEPLMVGGAAAQAVNDPKDALAQLNARRGAAPPRRRDNRAAFAQVYAANPALAAAERRQNRPAVAISTRA